jgi:ATP synthase protein I
LKKSDWQDLFFLTALPLEMLFAVVIGAVLGYCLDRRFQTQPWLLLLFMFFGIAAAARALWRDIRNYQERQKAKGSGDGQK